MRVMALDLGNRTGIALGVAGGRPRIEAWQLKDKGDTPESAARNLACALEALIRPNPPDLIAVENYMNPAAQPSADVIVTHLLLHGAVEAIAGLYNVPTERPSCSEIRKHFCGQPTARRRPAGAAHRSARQRAADRAATNIMILERAIVLGYLPANSSDWDKANAAALWDYAAARWAKQRPAELVLFGERAASAAVA